MMPTPEQIEQWNHAALASHWADLENGKRLGDIAGITDRVVVLAASWAREQALEEAAKVCADLMISGGDNASYCWGAGDCEKSIRALKEKDNEHAPIPR